jgi:phage shock protein C
MTDPKRLYRSKSNRMVAGVCGGLGDYFSLDPVLFRILFVALAIAGGSGILIYIILIFVIPEEGVAGKVTVESVVEEVKDGVQKTAQDMKDNPRWFDNRRNLLAGLIIAIGAIALLNQFAPFHWLTWNVFWPVVIIAVGVLLIIKRR